MSARLRAWLRVPVLLVRFPAILAAVAGAAAVVAVASAASPLFLASASTAAVQADVSREGPAIPAFSLVDYSTPEPDLMAYRDHLLVTQLRRAGLDPPVRSILGTQVEAAAARRGRRGGLPVVPMTREGAVAHIRPVERTGGVGAWLAVSVARALEVRPGDRLALVSGVGGAEVRVIGTYRDLAKQPRTAYWAPLSGLIYPTSGDPDQPPPPPFLIIDRGTLLRLEQRLEGQGQFRWEFSANPSMLTLPEAERLAGAIARTQSEVGDPSTALGSAFGGSSYSSPVFDWVTQARQTMGAITGPVEALSMAARIVALVIVAAAGVFAVHRRRVEFDLLDSRGVGPVGVGIRSAVEALIPAAAGAALGWVVALFAVKAAGPSSLLPTGTAQVAFRQAAWTAAAGVVLLGAAVGLAARSRADTRPGRMREVAGRMPWETVVLALAAASFYEILTRGGGPLGAPDEPPQVDRLLLLFPILFVAGAAGLAIRGLRRVLPRLRAARTGSAPAYLALRRLAAAPRMALLLVTASALAVGMLAYSGVLSTSIRGTADDKALLSTGSDVALILGGRASAVPGIPTTPIERVTDLNLSPSQETADVLAIDRSTFPRVAYWDDRVIGASLEEAMRALGSGPADRVPVVVAGAAVSGDITVGTSGIGSIPIRVALTTQAFPGMRPGRALVVADQARLFRLTQAIGATVFPNHELWARGDPERLLPALRSRHVPTDVVATAEGAKSTPRFLALSWTFGYLEALGVAAGLVALLGMVLYLQARQRDREVAYALARRMGLSSPAHRASVAGELAGMLLAAFVIGTGLAVVAAALVYGRLDPLPTLPPAPLLRLPGGLFAAAGGTLLVASAAGAMVVQRRADRANVAEVMRLAGG